MVLACQSELQSFLSGSSLNTYLFLIDSLLAENSMYSVSVNLLQALIYLFSQITYLHSYTLILQKFLIQLMCIGSFVSMNS